MNVIKHYHSDPVLREGFNRLAEATFGLNFEAWYQNGFWQGEYTPYSAVEDGKIVANVSLNRTDMRIGDRRLRLYQLGTVMTDPAYRNRGYIRAIMKEIDRDTQDADGVYLFGNDNVLDFYPKFGFTQGAEFLYEKDVFQHSPCAMRQVPMKGPEDWARLRAAMDMGEPLSACAMEDNPGLIFFYVSQFMRDNVYCDPGTGVWAIAEMEAGKLLLHNVFCPQAVTLDDVIAAFGADVHHVTLGFTPADAAGFACAPYHEEDCTFFVKGGCFEEFAARKLRIPSLSHA